MENYFKAPEKAVLKKELPLNRFFGDSDQCSDLRDNVKKIVLYAILNERTYKHMAHASDDSFYNEIAILYVFINSMTNCLSLAKRLMKTIPYQTIICLHANNRVCFMAGKCRLQNRHPYRISLDKLYYSCFDKISDRTSQDEFHIDDFNCESYMQLYNELATTFNFERNNMVSKKFCMDLYMYVTNIAQNERDKAKARKVVNNRVHSHMILHDDRGCSEMYSGDDLYCLLTSIDPYLEGDDLIELLHYNYEFDENFNVELPQSIKKQLEWAIEEYYDELDQYSGDEPDDDYMLIDEQDEDYNVSNSNDDWDIDFDEWNEYD